MVASTWQSRPAGARRVSQNRLRVVLAVQGRSTTFEPPVDLMGLGMPPLGHPVLEARQQHDRDGIRRRWSDDSDDDNGSDDSGSDCDEWGWCEDSSDSRDSDSSSCDEDSEDCSDDSDE